MSHGRLNTDDSNSPETIRRFPSGMDDQELDPSSIEGQGSDYQLQPTEQHSPSELRNRLDSDDFQTKASQEKGSAQRVANPYPLPGSGLGPTDVKTPSAGSSLNSSMIEKEVVHIEVGQIVFRKYEVLELLGRGGMGEVWLVKDIDLDDIRALKMINKGLAFDSGARARLRQEAQAMVKIKHPNFATLYELRLDLHDIAYFVMEYIPGKSLEKILIGQPMPLQWVDDVVTQLCEALHEAHSLGIIHRDLKPSNLIITTTPSGREVLKVLDFGIAKIPSSSDRPNELMTMDNAFMGTPPYASPEQACGRAVPLSDIYSVGVILYEFLTGRRPFRGHPNLVITDTISKPPPSFAEVNPDANVPAEIEEFVLRCLAKKPEDRPQSPHALLSEFREALAKSRPVVEIREDKPAPLHKTVPPEIRRDPTPTPIFKKNRRTFLVGGAVATSSLAIGIALVTLIPWGNGRNIPPIPTPTPTPTKHLVWNGRSFYLWKDKAYLPEGYKAVEPDDSATEGHPRTIIRDRDDVKFIWIPGGPLVMGAQAVSDEDENNYPTRPTIQVSGFYIQEKEVTNSELLAYEKEERQTEGSKYLNTWYDHYKKVWDYFGDDKVAQRHPVRGVSWRVAADFAKKRGGWLPTEAQWEFAARSGGQNRALVWLETDKVKKEETEKLANLGPGSREPWTYEGGQFPHDITDQGVMDMTGNVREWCRDRFEPFSSMSSGGPTLMPDDPDQTFSEVKIIARGGSFEDDLTYRYITHREFALPLSNDPPQYVGFRLVIECPPLNIRPE